MAGEKKTMLLLVVVMAVCVQQAQCWNPFKDGYDYVAAKAKCYTDCKGVCIGPDKECIPGCIASCLPKGYISMSTHRRHHHAHGGVAPAPAPSMLPKLQSSTVDHTAQGPAAASDEKKSTTPDFASSLRKLLHPNFHA